MSSRKLRSGRAKDTSFMEFVLDQLNELDDVEARPMFGGYGLYHKDIFFGILAKGVCYLRTNEESKKDYTARGMMPFRPTKKQTLRNYYELPVDILENQKEFREWALRAVACQKENLEISGKRRKNK